MRLNLRPAHLRRTALFWALAGASLLVAHDAVFFVQVGPGEPLARALRGGSHGYWSAASAVLVASAVLAAIAVARRLALLHRHARSLVPGPRGRRGGARARIRLIPGLWVRLLAIVALGFLLQENFEHLGHHGHVIGVAALYGSEYPLALPVLAAVTLVAATVGAAVLGIERHLLATIASLARRAIRAPRRAVRPPFELLARHRSPMANRVAGRAPPPGIVFPSVA